MQAQLCTLSSDCDFLYHCDAGHCVHDAVLPLSTYSLVVYVFAGLMSAMCNVAGASMGIFKMLVLIILLRYELDQATGLAQALVVGTAIPNFIIIILKKHPTKPTSLVNYKLLLVIIPCSLLGSTIGALAQTLIPKIGQISLLVVIFLLMAYSFVQKLRVNCREGQGEEVKETLINSESSIAITEPQEPIEKGKQRLLEYEKSHHTPEIFFSIFVFFAFQFLSFLVQGKLWFFPVEKCSLGFCIGIFSVFAVTLLYLSVIFLKMKRIYKRYRKYSFDQEIHLDRYREFLFVTAGAFAAGTIQGLLGMGCGTCIMMVLLSFPIASTSASATSGYQILFTGTAALLEFYLNGEVQVFESIFMLGVCLVIGGIATVILYRVMQGMNQIYVNKVLYSIILFLCLMSVGLSVPTVLGILKRDGWAGLTSIDFSC